MASGKFLESFAFKHYTLRGTFSYSKAQASQCLTGAVVLASLLVSVTTVRYS